MLNMNFLVWISCGHSWPLHPDAQGSKSFSPSLWPQEDARLGADVHDFRCGRPWPEGLSKNFVQKKFALILCPYNSEFPKQFYSNEFSWGGGRGQGLKSAERKVQRKTRKLPNFFFIVVFWARFGGMERNECHTCVPWGSSSAMDVTSSVFQACLPPPPWWHVSQCYLYCATSFDIDTLLWHEWKFPGTTIYRDEPGERGAAKKRGEKCGEKCGEKRGYKFYRRKTAIWDLSRLFSFWSRDLVGNPLSWPLSPEIWQCRRLSLSTVQPIVERNAAECAKGFHPLLFWCCSD